MRRGRLLLGPRGASEASLRRKRGVDVHGGQVHHPALALQADVREQAAVGVRRVRGAHARDAVAIRRDR